MSTVRLNLVLAVLSGCLLGFSFPPSPFYTLAYVAFVPLFFLLERVNSYRQLAWYGYLFALTFHVITLYWTGGYTHMKDGYLMMAGTLLLIVHPFFYLPAILCTFFVQRWMGKMWSLVSFVFFWVAYEYSHALSQLSFPWIAIGNSQAYDLQRIQLSEFTSVYGLTFLILVFNVLAFFWIIRTARSRWRIVSLQSGAILSCLFLVYMLPWLYGSYALRRYENLPARATIKVGLIQPNVDPFEKWQNGTGDPVQEQLQKHVRLSRTMAKDSIDLILWSETAIPTRILLPSHVIEWQRLRASLDSIGVPVLTGFPYTEFFDSSNAPITAHRIQNSTAYYEDYNSVMLIPPGLPVTEIYKKMKLVPFAERIPYAESVPFLIEPLKWSVGISGWGLGTDTVLFTVKTRNSVEERFAGLVCYESAFPDFVRQFVLRGAEFIVVLTNDSWWGNTSGTYQHIAMASLRAVENRRWVIQCANGGISAFVDPAGEIHQATQMYTATEIERSIEPLSGETFYDRHGDLFARLCVVPVAVFLFVAGYSSIRSKWLVRNGKFKH